ncbi:ydjC-like family protein [Acinetobacter baumannii 1598530]|uniref:ChbG/HpnK family deacetylase n=1 Tax=Acinetobacter baumannii TaxID=470 RepID=UPI00046180FF|nr:ChbG/HpnK family deacetylase [Acinetobacter baumannii]KCY13443.1 ydjC-like family protein [Acinetobacter baumannii 1598530]MDC5027663.1 ChbG/HpnK family deacetylase [Acinetobacter baumannii]TPV25947.1 ChbG/HpnK family deacetylase [Acinetobacter baumannii]CAI3100450.1 Carbohydrate deacetylase [Acinetobacter baumannii]
MAKVCYCADDFAMNAEISDAIIQLIEQGALQATSCMTQSDLWETAAAKLKPFSDRVDIGLHLNLTHAFASGNLVFPLPMLIVRAWSASLNRELITQCIEEQWDLFVSVLGKQPDFIDGHQHIHQFPFIRDILLQLLKEKKFTGWIRNLQQPINPPHYRFKTRMLSALGSNSLAKACLTYHFNQNGQFAGIYDFKLTNYGQLNQYWLANAKDHLLIMCHPALAQSNDQDPIQHARIQEYQYFSSAQFQLDCQQYGIQLTRLGAMQ